HHVEQLALLVDVRQLASLGVSAGEQQRPAADERRHDEAQEERQAERGTGASEVTFGDTERDPGRDGDPENDASTDQDQPDYSPGSCHTTTPCTAHVGTKSETTCRYSLISRLIHRSLQHVERRVCRPAPVEPFRTIDSSARQGDS